MLLPRLTRLSKASILLVLLCTCLSVFAQSEPRRVLILHGVWKNDYWEAQFDRSFAEAIALRADDEVHVSSQYLGLNRALPPGSRERLLENINAIILEQDIDMVVGVQPDAINFLNDLPVASRLPSLLVLPDEANLPATPSARQSIILSAWQDAIATTLEQIFTLLPDTRLVEVISGNSEGDLVYLQRFRDLAIPYLERAHFNYRVGERRETLGSQFAGLPASTVVFTLPYNATGPDRQPVSSNSLAELVNFSPVPVFGIYDTQLDYDITGGHMTSVEDYARSAADSAVDLLQGGDPQILEGSASSFYTWNAVQRFKLPIERLGSNITIVGQPTTLFDDYPFLSALGINLILFFSVGFMVMLWMYRRSLAAQVRITASEQLAKESEERYRLLADNVADSIWVVEEGNTYLKYCSPSVKRITGFSQEEYLSTPIRETLQEKDFRALNQAMMSSQSEPALREVQLKHRNGGWVWVEIAVKPSRTLASGKREWVGVTRDISARKQTEMEKQRLEDQVRQSQKFESLGTLAGGIAHDFNNILTVIIGIADMLRMEFRDHPDSMRLLNRLMSASEKARNLVQQILTFSRQSKGKKVTVNAGSLVEESIQLIRSGKPANVTIETKICGDDLYVCADGNQLEQAIMNLVTNAIEAVTGTNGKILVEVVLVKIEQHLNAAHGELEPGPYVCIRVTDNGAGMSPEVMNKIFDPFFTSKELGNGMGLAIVHGIVMNHGGALELQSELNQGTTIEMYLPQAEAEAAVQEDPMQTDSVQYSSGKRIFVVDDQEELLDVVAAMLRQLGHDCITCSDPREAMQVIRQQAESLDLVITDYSMPDVTGLELMQYCQEHFPKVPVVISTGYGDKAIELSAGKLGQFDILDKPYNLSKLRQVVQKASEQLHS